MPQEALACCGIRYNQRLGRYVPPSPKAIKRAVRAVGAAAADRQLCARLRAEAAAGQLNWRHIAVDGKTMRGARDGDGRAPHLLAAYDVNAGAVLGQDSVDGKTNEITCFVPLLQAILDGRARRGHGEPGQDSHDTGGSASAGTDDDDSSASPEEGREDRDSGAVDLRPWREQVPLARTRPPEDAACRNGCSGVHSRGGVLRDAPGAGGV